MDVAENWKPIKGYEGLYEISDMGRVRSLDRETRHNFYDGAKCTIKGKILKPYVTRTGYIRATLIKGGKREKVFVHRLVAQAFLGDSEGKPQVNHIDGNKANNFASNLEWCTNKENTVHALKHGLLDECLRKRRKAVVRDDGEIFQSIAEAARESGLSASMVSDTVNGKRKDAKGRTFTYAKVGGDF